MGMTMTEKILARASGKGKTRPGDNVWVDADVLMTHDVCGPGTINFFRKHFGQDAKVWDPDKIVIIPDHFIWTDDPGCRSNVNMVRDFAREQGIRHYYDIGESFKGTMETLSQDYKGVCHVAMAQEGHNRPGEVIFGTDSHTCTSGAFGAFATGVGDADAALVFGVGKLWLKVPETMKFVVDGELPPWIMAKDVILWIIGDIGMGGATYRAMEFAGDGILEMSVEEKMTLCNMVIEAGGKNGVVEPTADLIQYVKDRTSIPFEPVQSDAGAKFHSERRYAASDLEPVVAKPHTPDNRALARELGGVKVDRAYIGSCTGGKMEDFRAAAKILQGQSVKAETYIVPATQQIYHALYQEKMDGKTLAQIFLDAGCLGPTPPGCQACLGGPADTAARANGNETVVSTTNRNFLGRMGSKQAAIYLASPLTAAASAVNGRITDPRDFLN